MAGGPSCKPDRPGETGERADGLPCAGLVGTRQGWWVHPLGCLSLLIVSGCGQAITPVRPLLPSTTHTLNHHLVSQGRQHRSTQHTLDGRNTRRLREHANRVPACRDAGVRVLTYLLRCALGAAWWNAAESKPGSRRPRSAGGPGLCL